MTENVWHEESKTPRRFCPECRYPMLKLQHFDGTSSKDAPGFSRLSDSGIMAVAWWDWIIKPIADALLAKGRLKRRQKIVQELKNENLALFPNSVICPHCLHVEQRC